MLTYSEIRELVLQGEFETAVILLLAHRLVFTQDVVGTYPGTVQVTEDSVLFRLDRANGGAALFTVTSNLDGTPAVDTDYDLQPEDVYGYVENYDEDDEVDPSTGKNGQPLVQQWQPEFEVATVSPEYREYLLDLLEDQGVDVESLTKEEEIDQIVVRFRAN